MVIRKGISRLNQDQIRKRVKKCSEIYERVFKKIDKFYHIHKEDNGFSVQYNRRVYKMKWKKHPFKWKIYNKALTKIEKTSKYYRSICKDSLKHRHQHFQEDLDFIKNVQFYTQFCRNL